MRVPGLLLFGVAATGGFVLGWQSIAVSARQARRSSQVRFPSVSVHITTRRDRIRVQTTLTMSSVPIPRSLWVADAATGSPWAFRARVISSKRTWPVSAKRAPRAPESTRLRFGPANMSGWLLRVPANVRSRRPTSLSLEQIVPKPGDGPYGGWEIQVRLPSLGKKPLPLASVVVDGWAPSGTTVRARTCDITGYGRTVAVLSSPPSSTRQRQHPHAPARVHRHLCVQWAPRRSVTSVKDGSVDVPSDAGSDAMADSSTEQ